MLMRGRGEGVGIHGLRFRLRPERGQHERGSMRTAAKGPARLDPLRRFAGGMCGTRSELQARGKLAGSRLGVFAVVFDVGLCGFGGVVRCVMMMAAR